MKLLKISTAAALLATALPLTVHLPAPGMDEPLVRIASACGQATDCDTAQLKICSKADGDVKDAKCTAGCDNQVEALDALLIAS